MNCRIFRSNHLLEILVLEKLEVMDELKNLGYVFRIQGNWWSWMNWRSRT